ncbi:overexpressed in colon carcinoma 1 protein-like [Notolabrus celidotus]|uniref:overexpressed in colon carcinoma 1 protein-like n=1 Tax=Notolabrus celidotus TaxID=1203425 RepID=UPI0014907EF0|nr:overexpressed in colon carcinoma 1 protein-like [Notolabrus celidotus]
MGCGNSSPANTNNVNDGSSSSSNSGGGEGTAGPAESSSKGSEESVPEDDKWKNYGGVYVGFPSDMSNIPQIQIGSLRENERDAASLRRPLWGNGL